MEEGTSQGAANAPPSDPEAPDTKKMSIKFANNPKVLNMCQDPALRAAKIAPMPTIPNIVLSPQSSKIATTTSLLKKLPGNISVSTQRVSIQQPVSLMPNKPVVVQAINSPTADGTTTNTNASTVSAARKVVFSPGDSRFLKIVNATPENAISAAKKVIVQRVEQIKPPKSVATPGTPQDQVIVVPSPKIILTKNPDEPYIVNEMPPELRTKAIVVSSNNPTGDQTLEKRDFTKKLLPILPKVSVSSTSVKLPTTSGTIVKTYSANKINPPLPQKPIEHPQIQRIFEPPQMSKQGEFFGDEKKSSFEKLVDKFPEQISKVVADVAKITQNPVKVAPVVPVQPGKNVIKFDSIFNTINIQITDGKLSNPNGPIQLLDKNCMNVEACESADKINKSPRLKARSKSTAIDQTRRIVPGRMNRSPSLSSILPEFTKQSKSLIKEIEQNEARRSSSLTPENAESTLDTLLCDENMDNVSGTASNESSPTKASDISQPTNEDDKENLHCKNGNEPKPEETDDFDVEKDTSNENDENSDVEVVGFPDPDWSQMTPPESPAASRAKKRRASNDESEDDVPKVLRVPVHKLFKYQSDRITDDIHLSDPFRHITWKDGIGSLEDSTIHFKVNQLGVYEVMTNEEYYALKRHKPDQELLEPVGSRDASKRKRKSGVREVLYKCMVCRGSGTADEFRSPTVCSWSCEDILLKKIKTEDDDGSESNSTSPMSDLDDTSQQESLSSFSIPATKIKKEFDAPPELFQNPFPAAKNHFQVGMKLEAIDPANQSLFCVCTVDEKRGYRLKLRFDSFPADYNFWVDADSRDIFPPGWCSATDRIIDPPNNYNGAIFDWNTYLKDPKVMAPVQMFPHLKINEPRNEFFKPGMKMEVDCPIKLNLAGVTPATITDVIGRRILVHLDFFDVRFDFWTYIDSPVLHPINYHKTKKGVKLRTLTDKEFNWANYLNQCRQSAVPEEAFASREPIPFQIGMKLEVVDPKNEGLVRPAVVTDVEGHRICVLFENWPVSYAYWLEDDDPSLHPTNWAKVTKHPIESHRPQKNKSGNILCPVIKFCRNVGNFLYKSRLCHKVNAECPYLPKNWASFTLSDRLDYKKKLGAVPKVKKPVVPSQKTTPKRLKPKPNGGIKEEEEDTETPTTIVTAPLKTEEQVKLKSELLKINSTSLPENAPTNWTVAQVAAYLKTIPACEKHAATFETQEIDGLALLSLTKDDLMEQLNIKFGPAVKIYNCILKLREEILSEIIS
ncbi:lethal(3)malignant brain tumor-like protein 1 [Culicoides brevitarsis]|uniref:lethal(3)malignant brain tumor-like protein 1 n=1 Tax=Culicoides brevitarsis TaxID=469753 RepID=UPI00307CC095